MYNILTLNKIAQVGLSKFDKNKYQISEDCKNPDGIILRSFSMHEMELPESLLGIARAGAGTNNIPIDKCTEKGIVVFNTPGANANAVKELVVAGLLISSRKIVDGINWAKTLKDQGDAVAKLVEKGKSSFAGPEIAGKTLGVIGLGAIGVMVANVAQHLGMEVIGYDPYISIDAAWSLSRHIKRSTDLNYILSNCDYISMHVPLNDSTRHMISTEQFDIMQDGTRVLNFSRGELVDNDALKVAIAKGKVSCYVTDFPTDDLIDEEGIICIPHLGASTPESEDNCAQMAAEELEGFLENGEIINSVNFPDCTMVRSTKTRVTVIHKNIPSMLGKITNVLASEGTNISNLLNKSKKEIAYTMLDVEDVSEPAVEAIKNIEGVARVRVL